MKESGGASQKVSGFAFPAMILFLLSLIAVFAELAMLPTEKIRMGAYLCSMGLLGSFLFGCIYHNLTMTEEEGRLPKTPPLAGWENNCVDDPELDRC